MGLGLGRQAAVVQSSSDVTDQSRAEQRKQSGPVCLCLSAESVALPALAAAIALPLLVQRPHSHFPGHLTTSTKNFLQLSTASTRKRSALPAAAALRTLSDQRAGRSISHSLSLMFEVAQEMAAMAAVVSFLLCAHSLRLLSATAACTAAVGCEIHCRRRQRRRAPECSCCCIRM